VCAVYHYTDKLGYKFLGLVPLLIPVAWFMMSYPSFIIADRLIPSTWQRWPRLLSLAAVGGLVMTAGRGHGPDHGGGRALGLGY
jgi:uncharacterized membrane protein